MENKGLSRNSGKVGFIDDMREDLKLEADSEQENSKILKVDDQECCKLKGDSSPEKTMSIEKGINFSSGSRSSVSSQSVFDKYEDCTICLDQFLDGQKVKVMPSCEHIFHEKCFISWLDYQLKCPNCNQAIDIKDSDPMISETDNMEESNEQDGMIQRSRTLEE